MTILYHISSTPLSNSRFLFKNPVISPSIISLKKIVMLAFLALASCYLLFKTAQAWNKLKKNDDLNLEIAKKINAMDDVKPIALAKKASEAEIFKKEASSAEIAKTLALDKARKKAIRDRMNATITVVDIGTGQASLKEFQFDSISKSVYGIGPKISLDKKTSPKDFLINLKKNIPSSGEAIVYGTSWARNPNDSEKTLLNLLYTLSKENPRIKVKILSQPQEAEVASISFKNLFPFFNPHNPLLTAVNAQNTIQLEGGNGSIQSHAVLPLQKSEKSGKWIYNELNSGKNLTEVKNALKAELKSELTGPEAVKGIKNVCLLGVFAVALHDSEIIASLNVKTEEWIAGQIPVPLPKVIVALQKKIQISEQSVNAAFINTLKKKKVLDLLFADKKSKKNDKKDLHAIRAFFKKLKADDNNEASQKILNSNFEEVLNAFKDISKSIPAAACLAMLEAFQEKYGSEFRILTMNEDMKLFDVHGNPTKQEAKVSGAHGVAVKYFNELEQELG